MPFAVTVGALLIAGAVPMMLYAVASGRANRRQELLAGARPADLREVNLTEAASTRVVIPVMQSAVAKVKKLTPVGWIEALERQIVLAGLEARWPLERVLAVKVLLGALGLLGGYLALRGGRAGSGLLLPVLAATLGFFGPDVMLRGRAQERQQAILTDLPDALDQITMSVEAGLGFEAAVGRAASTGHGPLADEFTRALQEMQIGVSRSEALRNLAERTDVGDLRTFISAIVQSENYGLPIAQVLRVQAAEMRTKRRQRAEERALKLPVKIIFPLLFCIFPVLFIVLLGPAAIRIWNNVLS